MFFPRHFDFLVFLFLLVGIIFVEYSGKTNPRCLLQQVTVGLIYITRENLVTLKVHVLRLKTQTEVFVFLQIQETPM